MTTIHRTIEVPADRRLHFNLELPDDLPAGQAELYMTILPSPGEKRPLTLADFAGCLKDNPSFVGDALEIQKEMRNEADAPVNRAAEVFGLGRGQVWMSDDFDAPDEDFAEYM